MYTNPGYISNVMDIYAKKIKEYVLYLYASGWLYDQTAYYPASFFLGGAISLLGVPLLVHVCRSVINKQ